MLTNQVPKVRGAVVHNSVSVWTCSPERTMALEISFAYRTIWSDAVSVGLKEEWRESEFVLWSLMFEDLTREVLRTWAEREYARSHYWGRRR